ncbi:hypothetical protein KR059_010172 [Drosophila kikkawai]|nr:hypothetical protein KR059_010172 [Drosophila kikkawai]
MDHHTYAKSGSKKWSAEEKRQLVVQRIAADELFSKYSPKHAEPWKKFKDMAKIGDFSEIALRKQWFSMVQRYRVHKANTVSGTLNKQKIDDMNKEWEFFGLIHAYMNQKTADLHSYALKEPNVEPPSHNLAIASVYSCEELSPLMLGVLNDHNFCERSPPNAGDATDDVDDSPSTQHNNNNNNNDELNRLLAEATARKEADSGGEDMCLLEEMECGPVMIGGEVSLSNSRYNQFDDSPPSTPSSPSTQKPKPMAKTAKKAKRKGLSAKDKYYKHRLGYEQRMEKRLMGLCTVVGRLLQQFAPNVDVQPLLDLGDDSAIKSPSPDSSEEYISGDEEEEDI